MTQRRWAQGDARAVAIVARAAYVGYGQTVVS